MQKARELIISWGSLWKVVAVLAIIAGLFVSRDIVIAILLAVIISAALDMIVDYFEVRRIPRILSTIAIYIIGLFVFAMIVYIAVPVFLVEFDALVENSGELLGSTTQSFGVTPGLFEAIRQVVNDYTANFLSGQENLVSVLSQFMGGIVTTLVIFVISFYLTIGNNGVEKFLITITPERHHMAVLHVYDRVRHKLSRWFLGQLFLSVMIGILVFVGLSLLGVKYSFILAVIAAVLELIPYVGPIFSGATAALIASGSSPTLALYTVVLFFAIQQFENHVLVPAVNQYTTSLDPVIVIVALLIGAQVFGIIGIILAVPLAVAGQEILTYHAGQKKKAAREALESS